MKLQNQTRKWLLPTGLRLHEKQVAQYHQSRDEKTSTIKYKLYTKDQQLFENLVSDIKSDTFKLFGENLFTSQFSEKAQYTLVDFWLDTLRAGFIYKPSDVKLLLFINSDLLDEIFMAIPPEYRSLMVKKESSVPKLFSDFRPGNKSFKEAYSKRLLDLFNKKNHKNLLIIQLVETLVYESDVSKNTNIALEYLRKKLNVQQTLPENPKKYTIYPHPMLEHRPNLTTEAILERLVDFAQQPDSAVDEKLVSSLLGLENNQSGLNNAFGTFFNDLLSNDTPSISSYLKSMSPLWQNNDENLYSRLNWLKEQAKKLEKPQIAKHYGDYRTLFGAYISSWAENKLKHMTSLQKDHVDMLSELQKLKKHLDETTISDSQDYKDTLTTSLHDFMSAFQKSNKTDDDWYIISFLFGELRSDLYRYFQNSVAAQSILKQKDEKKSKKTKDNEEKDLSDRLKTTFPKLTGKFQTPSKFFGEQKTINIKKYHESIPRLYKLFDIYRELRAYIQSLPENANHTFDPYEYLQKIANAHLQLRKQHSKAVEHTKKVFADLKIAKIAGFENNTFNERERFWVHPKTRSAGRITIIRPEVNEKNLASQLYRFAAMESELCAAFEQKDFQTAQDLLKLMQLGIGFMLSQRLYTPIEKETLKEVLKNSDSAYLYAGLFDFALRSKHQFEKLIQNFVFAEIRGTLTKMSMKQFTEKYLVRMVGGESKWKLLYSKLGGNKLAWSVDFGKATKSGNSWHYLKKNKKVENKYSDERMDIRSSKYHIAYLNRLIDGTAKKRGVKYEYSTPSLILEETIEVDWNIDASTKSGFAQFQKLKEDLYIAYPFVTTALNTNTTEQRTYLGVDIGEYGLGYAVIDKRTLQLLDSGFITDNQYRSIAKNVDTLKNQVQTGTLFMPSTNVARLRESTVASYRNRIHALQMRHQATIVYEKDIDAFETGSNRILKVYNSIKQSDANSSKNDTNEKLYEFYWGSTPKGHKKIGKEVRAYGTSYICPVCRRSPYEYIKNDILKASEIRVEDTKYKYISEITIGTTTFFAYVNRNLDPKKHSHIRKAIKEYARPPFKSKDEPSKALAHFLKHHSVNSPPENFYLKNRGNQYLYLCPFADCSTKSVLDADTQAAINIALKQYCFDNKNEDEEVNFFEDIKNFSSYPSAKIL